MLPVNFKESNAVLTKPSGMTDEQCSDLPVFKGQDANGLPYIVSHWIPTAEELKMLKKGSGVWLCVVGQSAPPVSLQTSNPF